MTTRPIPGSADRRAGLDFLFDRNMKPFADLLALLSPHRPRAALLFFFSGMTALFAHGGLVTKLGGPAPTSDQELAMPSRILDDHQMR